MRAVIQRSKEASVEVENNVVGKINSGLVILLGITEGDTEEDIKYLIEKIVNMRLFGTEEKSFQTSLIETNQEILLISQFTLYASCKKGRRPDFAASAKSDVAKPIYEKFKNGLIEKGIKVETGVFGAYMKVALTNDGPITIILDSKTKE